MNILIFDTATAMEIAAVSTDKAVSDQTKKIDTSHSITFFESIDLALKEINIELKDINLIGVGIGPGSFTGLRIGLSTTKGFSFATGKPIVAVSTLEALAWNLPYCPYPVCTLLDARKKEVYAALFRWEEQNFTRLMDEASGK